MEKPYHLLEADCNPMNTSFYNENLDDFRQNSCFPMPNEFFSAYPKKQMPPWESEIKDEVLVGSQFKFISDLGR